MGRGWEVSRLGFRLWWQGSDYHRPNRYLGCCILLQNIAWFVSFGYTGKGESEWDFFWHENRNMVKDRSTADIACNSYHLWREDIQLLKQLGVRNKRSQGISDLKIKTPLHWKWSNHPQSLWDSRSISLWNIEILGHFLSHLWRGKRNLDDLYSKRF